jgi:hypothetical protein
MLVQEYLRSGKTLEDLKAEYGVESSICNEIPVVALNYNQISADMSLPMVQECRASYLELDTWNVVFRAFDKFFNYEETNAAPVKEAFDWNSAMVQDKVDGSLIAVYNYKGNWYVGTRSSPTAAGGCGSFDFTFKELILLTMEKMGFSFGELFPGFFYAFELTTPMNIVVVPHTEYKLTWIGVWNAYTLQEASLWDMPEITVPKVKKFDLKTMDEITEFVKGLSPSEAEGIVLVDKNYNRLKIKSEDYVRASRAISNTSTPKQRVAVLLSDHYDDIYGFLPLTVQQDLDVLKKKLQYLLTNTQGVYDSIKHFEVQKDFALEAIKYPFKAWLFEMRKGKFLDDLLKDINVEHLEALLNRIELE